MNTKNILKTLTKLSLATTLALTSAQSASDTIGYQGVAFNSGSPVASSTVGLQFTVYEDDNTTVVYQESATATTTDKGYFSHDIGSGTASGTAWSAVQWGDNYTLKTEIDVAGGTSYTDLGIQEFKSVAYAKNGLNNYSVSATGDYANAFGYDTNASGDYSSTAMGYETTASGRGSIATGIRTTASGYYSMAVGIDTVASGISSNAMGHTTVADTNYMTAVGRYNITGNTDALFVVGNGTGISARADAFEVESDGDIRNSGDIYPGDDIYLGSGDYIYNANYTTDYFGWGGDDGFRVRINGSQYISTFTSSISFNGDKNDIDFRVSGDTQTNLLYVDASADRVGIGKAPERALLEIANPSSTSTSPDTGGSSSYFLAGYTSFTTTTGNPFSDFFSIFAGGLIGADKGFAATSDERIKENITPITNSIDTIKKLRPVHYTKIDKLVYGDRKNYGFIAQELEEVIPESVTTGKGEVPILKPYDKVTFEDGVTYTILVKNGDDIKQVKYTTADDRPDGEIIVKSKEVDDFKSVTYDMVFTVAVDAIQEQQELIENLQSQREIQNKEIKELKAFKEQVTKALSNAGIEVK